MYGLEGCGVTTSAYADDVVFMASCSKIGDAEVLVQRALNALGT